MCPQFFAGELLQPCLPIDAFGTLREQARWDNYTVLVLSSLWLCRSAIFVSMVYQKKEEEMFVRCASRNVWCLSNHSLECSSIGFPLMCGVLMFNKNVHERLQWWTWSPREGKVVLFLRISSCCTCQFYRTGEAKIYSSSARRSAHVQRCLSDHAMYVATEVWAQPARCWTN